MAQAGIRPLVVQEPDSLYCRRMIRHRHNRRFVALIACYGVLGLVWATRGCVNSPSDSSNTETFPLTRTVYDPASAYAGAVDLEGAVDFRLTMGDGSGWGGYNVIKVGADGRCEYTFFVLGRETNSSGTAINTQQWKRAEFTLEAQTLAELRKLLAEVNFFKLKKEYHANVADGTQRWIKVEASGKRKGVYCDNHFPLPFMRVRGFVIDNIIRAHLAEIGAARTIQLDPKDIEPESFN